jgi:hypothetical protein
MIPKNSHVVLGDGVGSWSITDPIKDVPGLGDDPYRRLLLASFNRENTRSYSCDFAKSFASLRNEITKSFDWKMLASK